MYLRTNSFANREKMDLADFSSLVKFAENYSIRSDRKYFFEGEERLGEKDWK